MALNVETLVRCGVPRDKARAYLPLLAAGMREFGITTRPRARMYLANLLHESAAFKYMEEIASGAAYEGRRDLGNVRPGDGRRFKGRGPIQLTGRANYTRYGKLLGLDLVNNPKLAAEPRVGFRTAAAYFKLRGLNELADRGDFRGVCRAINGGFNGYADRARYYALLGGLGVVPGHAYIKRGDKGDQVVVLTRRLSKLVSAKTRKPYLDGQRKVFDRETEKALRRFQKEHKLKVDGRLGPETVKALAKAVEERKRERRIAAKRAALLKKAERKPAAPAPGKPAAPAPGKPVAPARERATVETGHDGERPREPKPARPVPSGAPAGSGARGGTAVAERAAPAAAKRRRVTSEEILDRLDALDARSAKLRDALRKRHAALQRVVGEPDLPRGDGELRRLYEQVNAIDVTVDRMRVQIAEAMGQPAPPQSVQPAPPPSVQPTPPPSVQPTPPPSGAAQPGQPEQAANGSLDGLSFVQLMDRLDRAEAEAEGLRLAIGQRTAALEQRLVEERARRARQRGPAERPPARPRRDRKPSDGPVVVTPKRKAKTPRHEEPGGHVGETRKGDRAHIVKGSKIALARYLKKHRAKKTARLRAALLAEARVPRRATLATPTWERGVRWAQQIANLEETGVLDRRLDKLLHKHWPSEGVIRRTMRSTPAWRTIPGQLTRNFNIRELGCKDGTPYVDGLRREQGLSKRQARERAKQLATYLERVREKEGGRPLRITSAYRTKAYNARLSGSATNSAHTRGFAVDIPPPPGMSLSRHRDHMRAVFPSGIGYYPRSNFVHGDFDPGLGKRTWVG